MNRRCAVGVLFAVFLSAATPQPLAVPFIEQQKNGCGAATLAMVVHYWRGESPDPRAVYQRLYRPDVRGIRLADMKTYLEELGFHAFTVRGGWSEVERNLAKGRPMIVGLKTRRAGNMHFAVVIGAGGDHVWLNDPTRRRAHRVSLDKFAKQWELADRWVLLAAPAEARLQHSAGTTGEQH